MVLEAFAYALEIGGAIAPSVNDVDKINPWLYYTAIWFGKYDKDLGKHWKKIKGKYS